MDTKRSHSHTLTHTHTHTQHTHTYTDIHAHTNTHSIHRISKIGKSCTHGNGAANKTARAFMCLFQFQAALLPTSLLDER